MEDNASERDLVHATHRKTSLLEEQLDTALGELRDLRAKFDAQAQELQTVKQLLENCRGTPAFAKTKVSYCLRRDVAKGTNRGLPSQLKEDLDGYDDWDVVRADVLQVNFAVVVLAACFAHRSEAPTV